MNHLIINGIHVPVENLVCHRGVTRENRPPPDLLVFDPCKPIILTTKHKKYEASVKQGVKSLVTESLSEEGFSVFHVDIQGKEDFFRGRVFWGESEDFEGLSELVILPSGYPKTTVSQPGD